MCDCLGLLLAVPQKSFTLTGLVNMNRNQVGPANSGDFRGTLCFEDELSITHQIAPKNSSRHGGSTLHPWLGGCLSMLAVGVSHVA